MADKLVTQQLKAYVEHVIENDLSSTEARIKVLVELRDFVSRLLDEQE